MSNNDIFTRLVCQNGNVKCATSRIYIAVYDLHWPYVDWPTWNIVTQVAAEYRDVLGGFIFGGDQLNLDYISHHNKGKRLNQENGRIKRDVLEFDRRILSPLESKCLPKGIEKIWLTGNHEHWVTQYIEENPEVEGCIEPETLLRLNERGWRVLACGERYKVGKLSFIHGETLTGKGNQACTYHAKKAVEMYCGSVVYGHTHAPQMYTKVLPYDEKEKWAGWCSPIAGRTNASYLRNAPTAWLNGFMLVEIHPNGCFNVWPVIVSKGQAAFAGRLYRG